MGRTTTKHGLRGFGASAFGFSLDSTTCASRSLGITCAQSTKLRIEAVPLHLFNPPLPTKEMTHEPNIVPPDLSEGRMS